MDRCLIIGYGRAGQRHAQDAQALEIETYSADPAPQTGADYDSWQKALLDQRWDYIVIASPPECHLEQLRQAARLDIPILCEKPLCTPAAYKQAACAPLWPQVMVAYNWRYNSAVQNFMGDRNQLSMVAQQTRQLPAWGGLADHVSHDLDIMQTLGGPIAAVDTACHVETETKHEWHVAGTTMAGSFLIREVVYKPNYPSERCSEVNGVPLLPERAMFERMWQAFVHGHYYPNLRQARNTQWALYRAWELLHDH